MTKADEIKFECRSRDYIRVEFVCLTSPKEPEMHTVPAVNINTHFVWHNDTKVGANEVNRRGKDTGCKQHEKSPKFHFLPPAFIFK